MSRTAIQSRRDRVVGVVQDDSRGEYVFCDVALHVFDGSRMQWLGFRRGVVVEYSGNAIRKTMKGPLAPFFLFFTALADDGVVSIGSRGHQRNGAARQFFDTFHVAARAFGQRVP